MQQYTHTVMLLDLDRDIRTTVHVKQDSVIEAIHRAKTMCGAEVECPDPMDCMDRFRVVKVIEREVLDVRR